MMLERFIIIISKHGVDVGAVGWGTRKVEGSIPALGLTLPLTEMTSRGRGSNEVSESVKCEEFLDYLRTG